MFVITLTYVKPLSDVDRLLKEHVEYLNKFYESGHFLLSGGQVPRKGGVILAKEGSLEAMQTIIEQDPFHVAGVAHYEVVEFNPTKACQSFTDLIHTS